MDYGVINSDVGDGTTISDEELSALALAAGPITLGADAVPWGGGESRTPSLLPNWYMPSPSYHLRGRATRAIVITLIVGFLVIDAFGLCITSGFLSFA
jgi:hypothetical protein